MQKCELPLLMYTYHKLLSLLETPQEWCKSTNIHSV
jgi:hypothetical protein